MDLNKLITKRIKEYALNGDAELLDKYGFLFNMIAKDYAEAINYTHCCKSDSELLKDKQKLSFEDWYRTYGYEKSVTGNFVKEGTRYTLDEMKFKYEYNMP